MPELVLHYAGSMDKNKAQQIVNSLGLKLYLRDGHLYQHPPGEEIMPQGVESHVGSHGGTRATEEPVS